MPEPNHIQNGNMEVTGAFEAAEISEAGSRVQTLADKGQVGGYAALDSAGKVPAAQLPALALTDTLEVADQPARLALTSEQAQGKIVLQLDTGVSYGLPTGTDPSDNGDWVVLGDRYIQLADVVGLAAALANKLEEDDIIVGDGLTRSLGIPGFPVTISHETISAAGSSPIEHGTGPYAVYEIMRNPRGHVTRVDKLRLGQTSYHDTLPVAHGGTGATTAGGALTALGAAPVRIQTLTISSDQTLTTEQCLGQLVYVTGPATITLPPIVDGLHVKILTEGDVQVSVKPDASDRILLDGEALDDGDKITNGSLSGDVAVLTYRSPDGWSAQTNYWTDGGP